MKQLERKVTITYNWRNGGEIPTEHVTMLEESAMERILSQMEKGYSSGQLIEYVPISGTEDMQYTGWWEMTTENIDG